MATSIEAFFNEHEDEFLKFDRIENPPSQRRDLCAFLLLDKLVPAHRRIVSAAGYEVIFLDVCPEKLAEVATEADLLYLTRCGVHYEDESLAMYV